MMSEYDDEVKLEQPFARMRQMAVIRTEFITTRIHLVRAGGHVTPISKRGGSILVRTASGTVGWVNDEDVQLPHRIDSQWIYTSAHLVNCSAVIDSAQIA